MAKMRVVQVPRPNGPLELIEREVPEPGAGTVRIKVQACGVCHSDSETKEGLFPGIQYPRVPGHEIIGLIDAIGSEVDGWSVGQRVGVGWHGGICGYCNACRHGDAFACETETRVTGVTHDGGYADYMIATTEALARIPQELSAVEAAPLMFAGVTTFTAVRDGGARPGDVAAILGLGGLGHLGVQFASRLGSNTVAIARGADKEPLARQLGARHYIDNTAEDAAAALLRLGGAKVILATVTSAEAMSAVQAGLGPNGTLMVIGVTGPIEVSAVTLIRGRRSVKGWYSGTSIDSQDTLAFAAASGVRSMNEVFPLERAAEAHQHMESGRARFRVVLTTGS